MRAWAKLALGAVGLAVGGLAVAASGVVPITASGGHWPVTEWLLHFTMRRSVATHSAGIAVPPLAAPGLAVRGAGHYETACRPCHGAPGASQPVVPRGMTPRPPDLADEVAGWDAEDLFYVVKHGIKMTGMPAWPTQERDDEVWAMVAFLRALPELDEAGYRALAFGDAPLGDTHRGGDPEGLAELGDPDAEGPLLATCARCHGVDGRGRDGATPALAGQRAAYLAASLRAYARGARASGIMQPVAAGLAPDEVDALARRYAALPPAGPREVDAAAAARGEAIARDGVPVRKVPSCADCHGPAPSEPRPEYPRLAGQDQGYLALQLRLFAEDRRGGTALAPLMELPSHALEPEERRDVAAYYASLAPEAAPEDR